MKPTNVNLSGKTILITGAAGFIGSYLVKNLLENIPDIQIVGIDNCNDYYDVALKEYRLKEKGAILNWFDVDAPEGRFSLNDKLGDIMSTFIGKLWFVKTMLKVKKQMSGGKKGKTEAAGFEIPTDGLMQMMGSFTVLRLTSMLGMANVSFTKEELLEMNKKLNRIRKPKSLR